MTFGSLFAGIGGFDLGFAAVGMVCRWQVEIDKRCRAFLSKAWPGIAQFGDIRDCGGKNLERVDLICGGVPCQPASRAGKQRGKEDDRWLWDEALRVVSELYPTWVVFENPPGIGDVGLAGILSQMENLGYERRVFGIPACAVGSPQIRMRYWIVANRRREEPSPFRRYAGEKVEKSAGGIWEELNSDVSRRYPEIGMANSARRQNNGGGNGNLEEAEGIGRGCDSSTRGLGECLADPKDGRLGKGGENPGRSREGKREAEKRGGSSNSTCNMGNAAECEPESSGAQSDKRGMVLSDAWDRWVWIHCADGKVRRAPDNSFSLVDGLHRSLLGALGNSVVPQVVEIIGRAIMEVENGPASASAGDASDRQGNPQPGVHPELPGMGPSEGDQPA